MGSDWRFTWNFKLSEDTTFHSGQEFTADDVKATFERVNDTVVASQVAFLYEMIEEVEVVNDYEVNLHTEYAFAPLPGHLSHNASGIMSKDLIDRDYRTRSKPVVKKSKTSARTRIFPKTTSLILLTSKK